MSRNIATETNHAAASTGQAASFGVGPVNVTVSGTFSATVQIERSVDAGTTYAPVAIDSATPLSLTAPVALSIHSAEAGTLFRSKVTSYTSGTAKVRISQ